MDRRPIKIVQDQGLQGITQIASGDQSKQRLQREHSQSGSDKAKKEELLWHKALGGILAGKHFTGKIFEVDVTLEGFFRQSPPNLVWDSLWIFCAKVESYKEQNSDPYIQIKVSHLLRSTCRNT